LPFQKVERRRREKGVHEDRFLFADKLIILNK
jgi:hypothetical protein